MQAHLDAGCVRCQKRVEMLAAVWVAGRQSAAEVPPDWVLERAMAVFPSRVVRPASESVTRWAELVFDSWVVPAAAGVRSGRSGTRELRYRAGDVELELHLTRGLGSASLQLVGQIGLAGSNSPPGSARVVLSAGGRSVAADCNEFGEFVLESRIGDPETLRVELKELNENFEVALPAE